MCAEKCASQQIDNRDAGPHYCPSALLICESRKAGCARRRKVHGIRDALGEHKKSGKDIARQRREEEVQDDRPLMPSRDTRPRLNDRPPEQKPGREEGCLLDRMPCFRLHSERKRGRNEPNHHRTNCRKPAECGLPEAPSEML